ncbi:hypothetical protein FB451DRAFT_1463416 [Mycena latifolia]|nr:hypothetical protein FB451DRAFT_1463416 [Mycena latifolia]
MNPRVYVTYTQLEAIRQGTCRVDLFPIEVFPDDLHPAQSRLIMAAFYAKSHLVDVINMIQPHSTSPAARRIQRAVAAAGCRHDPYAPRDPLDEAHTLRKLHDVWETAAPPDIVFLLGPTSAVPADLSPSALPLALPPQFQPRNLRFHDLIWAEEWEAPGLIESDGFTAAFHARTQLGRKVIFLSGFFVGGAKVYKDSTSTDCINDFLKTVLFRELVHLTRSELFGMDYALGTTEADAGDLGNETPNEAGFEAERLAFGAMIGVHISQTNFEGDDRKCFTCVYPEYGQRNVEMSSLHIRTLYKSAVMPLPIPPSRDPLHSNSSPIIWARHLPPVSLDVSSMAEADRPPTPPFDEVPRHPSWTSMSY